MNEKDLSVDIEKYIYIIRGQKVMLDSDLAMLSSVLRSKQATKINIEIIRTFIKLRHALNIHKDLDKRINELQSFILKHSHENDREFKKIWNMFKKLTTPSDSERKIGFNLN